MTTRTAIRRPLTLNLSLTFACLSASISQATLLPLPATVTQTDHFTWVRSIRLGPPGPTVGIPPAGPLPIINGTITQPPTPTGSVDTVTVDAFGSKTISGVSFGADALGAGTYAAFSQLHYENVITNNSVTPIPLVFNFNVAAGALVVACGGFAGFDCDGFASYSIDILLNGAPLAAGHSAAKLAFINGGTDTALTRDGFTLTKESGPFIGTMWTSFVTDQWDVTSQTVSLGTLPGNTSMTLVYDLIAEAVGNFPSAPTARCTPFVPPNTPGMCFSPAQAGTGAFIGDPSGLGPIGVGVALQVPEPDMLVLFAIAAAGLGFSRRRNAVARKGISQKDGKIKN
jgi:hypothetical protein